MGVYISVCLLYFYKNYVFSVILLDSKQDEERNDSCPVRHCISSDSA